MVTCKWTPCKTRPSEVPTAQFSDRHQGGPATGDAAAATYQLEQVFLSDSLCFLLGQISLQQCNPLLNNETKQNNYNELEETETQFY